MMKTRLNGTERPKKDAGGLRHGLLVLAVLLLTCVLMAGAVSAATYYVSTTGNDGDDGSSATPFATIQKAVDTAMEGDTILVASGTYDVTVQNTEDTADFRPGVQVGSADSCYTNLYITKGVTLKALDSDDKPLLTARYTSGMGYAQQTVYIAASNVTLDGFKILPITNYPNKVVEIIALDTIQKVVTNVTIQNCEIEGYLSDNDDTAAPIYIGSPGVGSYLVKNNVLNGTVCIVNGAGNAMKPGESGKIIGNTITNGALYLTGTRDSGWDQNQLIHLPVIENNRLGVESTTIDGNPIQFAIRSCDLDTNNLLSLDQMNAILLENDFTGYAGKVYDAEEKSYDAYLRFLVVTPTGADPVVSETVTPEDDGIVTITPPASESLVVDGSTVTLTAAGIAGEDDSVVLVVTYADGASVSPASATGTVTTVEAQYQAIPLERASGVLNPTVDLNIALKTVNTDLPAITGELDSVKLAALAKFGNAFSTFLVGPAFIAANSDLSAFNDDVNEITLTFTVPKSWAPMSSNIGVAHISDDATPVVSTAGITVTVQDAGTNWEITAVSTRVFSGYAVFYGVSSSQPPSSSSSGNMNNAYRVLFNDGSTTLSVQTDLSSGDKLTKPEIPVKDGYTFAGWYKDSACTQGWDFETGISGDMTLYAKWTAAGSSGETEATATPTKTQTAVTTPQPTKTQTAAATTSAPEATTAAGVSPTLTQAPAPVAGALFGLLAAGVLLRRRLQ